MRSPDFLLSGTDPGRPGVPGTPDNAQAEIVIPVRNEEHDLAPSVRRLHAFLRDDFPVSTRVTTADNGSTDGTWAQALALQAELPAVRAVRLERPGRGAGCALSGRPATRTCTRTWTRTCPPI